MLILLIVLTFLIKLPIVLITSLWRENINMYVESVYIHWEAEIAHQISVAPEGRKGMAELTSLVKRVNKGSAKICVQTDFVVFKSGPKTYKAYFRQKDKEILERTFEKPDIKISAALVSSRMKLRIGT